ncbi:HAD-IC family P-type ATPase [Kitasatospora sp. NBC_01287]|uniref:HAD-IC family P-type ATPase n=1 Tax=Kitasatospora sp. NBC_01287 TaxID=2903573 RepID=UPI002259CA83|nr:HAD-IC family P-type ATPase [Kitasatospora sp. NBC_01287]MCX4749291.1 HAD-IC family P-type ATPase [Kitasatospora sp. NBC_01287]
MSRHAALRAVAATPRGLTEAEAEARLAEHGENIVLPLPEPSTAKRLRSALGDPFTALLAVLSVVCAVIGSWGSALTIAALVLTACLLRLRGERRSALALRSLRALVPSTATVLRRAEHSELPAAREVPAEQLVPGDVVRLVGGDAVPADLRLLRAEGLTLDLSALTGESTPVPRLALDGPSTGPGGGPFDAPQLCFAGSTVVTGSATAVVLATGTATRFGAAHAPGPLTGRGRSVVERGMRRAVLTLIAFMVTVVPLTVTADTLLHGWSRGLLPFAVAAAVGFTPELLPLVVSSVLARGGHRLAKAGVPVRRLPAVGELGALDVLCLDKTGTLTTGELMVAGSLDPAGRPDQEPLRWAALIGEAALLDGEPGLLDPLDEALLDAADAAGLPAAEPGALLEVIPFDPVRRRSGAVLRERGAAAAVGGRRRVLVLKGAPEELLDRCAALPGGEALDPAAREALDRLVAERTGRGLRLIAVARAESEARLGGHRVADEDGLTLLGFVELIDRPEDSAEAALALLRGCGVALTVLTGDHPRTALRLAERLGLAPGRVLLGAELAGLDRSAIAAAGAAGAVFARCTPEQKALVVRALREAGHSVGFLGDGVNDVPALRCADVGIATAGAVGAAREWADLLLGGRDLALLGRAVAVGREATARVAAYLRIALSCNLGNALSMLAGGVLLPFLPMQPAQVLLQNLCFDAAQLSVAVSGRPAGPGSRPVRLRWGSLAAFALGFGLLNSFFDLAMFEAMRGVTRGYSVPNSEAMFHTAWFAENLVTQAVALPVLYRLSRTRQRPPRPVWWAAGMLAAVGLLLPPSALGERLGFEELPAAAYGSLALVVAGYVLVLGAGRWLWWRFGDRAERAEAARPAP